MQKNSLRHGFAVPPPSKREAVKGAVSMTLEAKNLTFRYPRQRGAPLEGVSLALEAGERFQDVPWREPVRRDG